MITQISKTIKTIYNNYTDFTKSRLSPPVWKRAQVQGLKEARLAIRWDEDQGLVSWGLEKSRHIVPTTFLVRKQCFRDNMYKVVKGSIARPIFLIMTTGSYFRYWMCLTRYQSGLHLNHALIAQSNINEAMFGEYYFYDHHKYTQIYYDVDISTTSLQVKLHEAAKHAIYRDFLWHYPL